MNLSPEKQKEYAVDCVAIGLLFLADYFIGKGKSKSEALSLAAAVMVEKVGGVAEILDDSAAQAGEGEQNG